MRTQMRSNMRVTLKKIRDQMSQLCRLFHGFEIETKSRQARLENINGIIARLLINLSQLGSIRDEKRETIHAVRQQGHALVEDLEKRLEAHGLARGADGAQGRGRGWGGLQRSRLALKNSQDVVMVEKEEWEGATRRLKRVAGYETQGIENNLETEDSRHEIMDLDAYMSDDSDCVITLVVDRTKQGGQSWVQSELIDGDGNNDNGKDHPRVVDKNKQTKETQVDGRTADENVRYGDLGGNLLVVDSNRKAEDIFMENGDETEDEGMSGGSETSRVVTLVVNREKRTEHNQTELGMRLMDEILWYDCSKDFDEDMLP